MIQRRMILSQGNNLAKFVTRLEKCESAVATRHDVTTWESDFVASLREYFESREDAQDLGLPEWNPTVNQWNTLSEIYLKVS